MKLTKITFSKIKFLIRNEKFKSSPMIILFKILLWEVAKIRNKKILYKFDKTFNITLQLDEGVSRLTYYFGYSEPAIFNFINYFLKDGMYFFDIGANIGLHSLFASKRVGNGGKVFSFEPCESIYKRLIENINTNNVNNIYSYKIALGEKDSKVDMVKILNETSRTYIGVIQSNGISLNNEIENVKMTTLDSFVNINKIRKINDLKLDVEGYEFNVLKGAVKTLSTLIPSVIQVEFDSEYLYRNNIDMNEIKKFFQKYKYLPFSLNNNSRLKKLFSDSAYCYNTFFINKYKISELSDFIE